MADNKSTIINEPITVLMPVYNAAAYLKEAIESILAQTYRNFQLLLIDDASSDNSVDIILSFKDNRIRLIHHERNLGIKDTLNEGIELANTELIARMDTDDISHPWRLQKQVDYLLLHPDCAMVSSLAKIIDSSRNYLRPYDPYHLDTYYGLYFDCYICHPAVTYRKSCVETVGKYTMQYSEDFDLWWKLSRQFKIYVLPEPLLLYRAHDQNYSRILKREEYDNAEYRIMARNFHDLLGNSVSLPKAYMACYNYELNPLIQLNDTKEIRSCIDMLDLINRSILSLENPNRNMDAILRSSAEKKSQILYGLGLSLPYVQMTKLMLYYKHYPLISRIIIEKIRLNLYNWKRIIKGIWYKKRKFSLHTL